MNKTIYLLFFICGFYSSGFAQESPLEMMMENDLKAAQKEGTNLLLKEYLSTIDSKSDTLYAILFRPMSCPRCESTIPFFTKTLKELYPQSETLLITDYEDPDAARQYLIRNQYLNLFDYHLFDPCRSYEKIFSFNADGLYGLFILKIDKKNGRLIVGGSPLLQNKQLIRELYETKEPYLFHTFENKDAEEQTDTRPANLIINPLTYETFPVIENESYPVSSVYNLPVMHDNLFFYSDELANAGYLFKIDREKKTIDFKDVFVADSLEKDHYVNIPPEDYLIRKRAGIIHYIACGMNFTGKDKIGLSYSLPRLFMETPDNMAYYNQPAIIVKGARSLKKEPMIELDFDLFNESFMYLHFDFWPLGDNKIVLECKKNTWPIEFPKEDYQGNIERDPFMDEFYDTTCPYLAIFDLKTGKMQQQFGQLDISQRLSRTGYFYEKAVVSCDDNKMVYGNGYTGKLYLASKKNPSEVEQVFSAFDIDVESFPQPDNLKFYELEYAKPYESFFNRCIESAILTGDKLYCLIRTGRPHSRNYQTDAFEYVVFDRKSGEVDDRFTLTPETADKSGRLLCFGLGQNGNKVTPYYFIKKDGKVFVKYMYRDKEKYAGDGLKTVATYYGSKMSKGANNPCKGATTKICGIIEIEYTMIDKNEHNTIYRVDKSVKDASCTVIDTGSGQISIPATISLQEYASKNWREIQKAAVGK